MSIEEDFPLLGGASRLADKLDYFPNLLEAFLENIYVFFGGKPYLSGEERKKQNNSLPLCYSGNSLCCWPMCGDYGRKEKNNIK